MHLLVVSVWMRRGLTYLALQVIEALERAGHRVHVLARPGKIGNEIVEDDTGELRLDPDRSTRTPGYRLPAEDFRALLRRHRFDAIVFLEEQWQRNLGTIAREENIPSVNIIMWEFFDPRDPLYDTFNVLVFPSRCGALRAQRHGYLAVHVPWGIDRTIWNGERRPSEDGSVRFIHCSGWGGVYQRKQTDLVIEVFKKVRRPAARLLVHRQTLEPGVRRERLADNLLVLTGNLERAAIVGLYRNADCALAPSKWEGLGFSLFEPQALGLPVITVDAPPMNETVIDGLNGMLAKVHHLEEYSGIEVPGAIVDGDDMVRCMQVLVDDPSLLGRLGDNALRHVAEHCDWARNGARFAKLVERIAVAKPRGGLRASHVLARLITGAPSR